jgi:hypothetical protein
MPSSKPKSFTVDFDEDGVVVAVRKTDGSLVSPQPVGNLPLILANVTVIQKTITEVIITAPSGGGDDPCVVHDGEIWCF